jgi:hypothetical protein
VTQVPDGYTPSYRTLIELAGRLSAEGLLGPALAGLAAPAVLGFGLRLLYTSSSLAAEGLTAFVVIAAATGLTTARRMEPTRSSVRLNVRVGRGGPLLGWTPRRQARSAASSVTCSLLPLICSQRLSRPELS